MPSRTVRDIAPEALSQFHPFRLLPDRASVSSRQKAAQETAASLAQGLKEHFKASRVLLFGSATRADFSEWSDIDLAVWGIAAEDYFKAVAYASGYSSLFRIDLVDGEDCQPALLRHIIRQGIAL